ncbi:transcription termination factor Rho [Entomospira nematocerorum]|uniref:Transcription termination factor Rho n=1 Tax=Entomospira nematocerorum TaxID=2719987 RepID=A0A968GDF1_9SPIO|nr:transcription termination factor Rho [Entomospira nematocera]NIZ47423.1 transcription termination factor Rho [Entomospira nematocera]WDI34039.1 transcription termination factor Rho [Entomospira nematocera]
MEKNDVSNTSVQSAESEPIAFIESKEESPIVVSEKTGIKRTRKRVKVVSNGDVPNADSSKSDGGEQVGGAAVEALSVKDDSSASNIAQEGSTTPAQQQQTSTVSTTQSPQRERERNTSGTSRNNKNGNHRRQQQGRNGKNYKMDANVNPPPADPNAPKISVNDLTNLSVPQLREKAEMFGIAHENLLSLKKQEIIMQILRAHTTTGGVIFAYGSLEILQDGYGFLRSPQNSYLAGSDDIYISPQQIRAFNLKTGDTVYGQIRSPKDGERFFAMQRVETVNLDSLEVSQNRVPFENLTPLFPDERLDMETMTGDVSTRVINLFCPIGKGQRGLIVAPPRTGKTVLMQKIANAITENHPECNLIVLLIDERPEEVTDMRRSVKGEVIASTFDEQASRHVQVAEMVLEKSKRMVEQGHDVVILLDSITRLARAYNQTIPTSGKILSGGVDSNALHRPKRFFGAARNIEGGGSLTIVATALVDTGSKMDTVIFEEFKGTGNMEVTLDRRLSDKRIFPSINIKCSGTRKEEMLLTADEVNKVWVLRKALSGMEDVQMTELILERMRKFKTNDAFLRSMNESSEVNRG